MYEYQKKCRIQDCIKYVKARELCDKHLYRLYKHGDPEIVLHKYNCSIAGCQNPHAAHGQCSAHYNKTRRSLGYFKTDVRKPSRRFTDSKRGAKQRGLNWIIDLDTFTNLIQQPCHYCSGELHETRSALDRKDNSQGYTIDNVVPCCKICNSIKSDKFTYEEFLQFSRTDLFQKMVRRIKTLKY
jgi:hypothetical protein